MVLCLETVQDNIGVNIGVNASRRYAMYGDSDSNSDRVRCFKCLASTLSSAIIGAKTLNLLTNQKFGCNAKTFDVWPYRQTPEGPNEFFSH